MKTLKPVLAGLALCLAQFGANAQPDTAKIVANALSFADSLVKSDHFEQWDAYANLVPLSVIKHYGGKDGYIQSVQKVRSNFISSIEEDAPTLKMQTLLTQDNQWQCVIRESRYIHRNDKKVHIITYLVGQSTDEGASWRLFDVGYNRVANIIYMMPDVFGDLPIPEHVVISEADELAAAQAAQAAAAKANAKAAPKKVAKGK
ncbi:MAG TPA: hypothetical protein VK563_23875 [Puia sp.]|nr:hypothetical protein [Puia sp.]